MFKLLKNGINTIIALKLYVFIMVKIIMQNKLKKQTVHS